MATLFQQVLYTQFQNSDRGLKAFTDLRTKGLRHRLTPFSYFLILHYFALKYVDLV